MVWRLLNFAIGVWLMMAPYVLGYSGAAATNDRICGPLIASFALIAMSEVVAGLRLTNIPIGIWLILAPFILPSYELNAMWSSLLSGAFVALIALKASPQRESYGGGWSCLFRAGASSQK